MAVLKIVANIETAAPSDCVQFYRRLFDLEPVMDLGWIATLAAAGQMAPVQLSAASEGGSATPVPKLSIEVDDLEQVQRRAGELGIELDYGPVTEPWGVRRFFLRDPAGTLINVLTHSPTRELADNGDVT